MLRIEGKHVDLREEASDEHLTNGEGLLFLAVLAASWTIAIALGWVIWRVAAL